MKSTKPKALLIYPPVYDFALYDLFLKPYGLLKIGFWLKKAGYDIHFINGLSYSDPETERVLGRPRRKRDGTGKFYRQVYPKPPVLEKIRRRFARYGVLPEVLRHKIAGYKPDIVLVSSGMTYWYSGVKEAVNSVKEYHQSVPIIVGGIYASLMPEHCKRVTGADQVISGSVWPGLGRILKNLNLPVPDTRLTEEPLILKDVWQDAGVIRLNSGCPFRCDYCASNLLDNRFSAGNPETTFNVIKQLYRVGVRSFAFYDDALLKAKEKALIPLLLKIIESRIDISIYLPNAVHLNYFDRQTALLMKKAGFQEIRIGLESSSEHFHRVHDEKVSVADFPEKLELLCEAGFPLQSIGVYIMAGLPGQRKDEVEASIRFAARYGVKILISEYSPVPGTGLWEQSLLLSRFNLQDEPLFHNNSLFPMESDHFSMEDLQRLKDLARRLSKEDAECRREPAG
ncbi:MAG: radical SAM protein [Spirochaetota bacterium]